MSSVKYDKSTMTSSITVRPLARERTLIVTINFVSHPVFVLIVGYHLFSRFSLIVAGLSYR